MSDKLISPPRGRMIEDMTVRNFVEKTRNDYIVHEIAPTSQASGREIKEPFTATTW